MAVGSNLVMTFSENVTNGTGTIVIYDSGGTVESFNVVDDQGTGNGTVEFSGTTVTINPTSDLPDDEAIYVQVGTSAITDTSSNANAYAGITTTTDWNFGTEDNTAPTASFSPADGASDVAVGSNLVMTFSENVTNGTGTIVIYDSGGTVESFNVVDDQGTGNGTVEFSGTTVTINPTSDLPDDEAIYVQVGTSAITDTSSNANAYAGITTTTDWNFGTEDNTAPTASFSPADGASDVAVGSNLVMTFSENVTNGTGTIVIYDSGGTVESFNVVDDQGTGNGTVEFSGTTVTINPTSDLPDDEAIYVQVGTNAITDTSSNANAYAGITTTTDWNFGTEDNTAPEIVNGVYNSAYIQVNFSEGVYGNSSASSPIVSGDYDINIYDDGGDGSIDGTTTISIDGLYRDASLTTGLAGNESTVYFEYTISDGTMNGNDYIVIEKLDNKTTYDEAGNEMVDGATTGNVVYSASIAFAPLYEGFKPKTATSGVASILSNSNITANYVSRVSGVKVGGNAVMPEIAEKEPAIENSIMTGGVTTGFPGIESIVPDNESTRIIEPVFSTGMEVRPEKNEYSSEIQESSSVTGPEKVLGKEPVEETGDTTGDLEIAITEVETTEPSIAVGSAPPAVRTGETVSSGGVTEEESRRPLSLLVIILIALGAASAVFGALRVYRVIRKKS